ncbi:MAG: alpha/beta fold hydrolase [Beijerinckiaceae bacterium]|nr:alpha/beta fold hydrolase [Beijerinckiaceae bacterium]
MPSDQHALTGSTLHSTGFSSRGALIGAHLVKPHGKPRLAVVLHGATGVSQFKYLKFARGLCEREQATVLIYDYRDMGLSARGPLRNSRVSMSDWAVEDQSAALDYLIEACPGLPVWVIGHSLGGMFVNWHRQADRVARVIAIASGPAYLAHHPPTYLPAVLWFWYLGGPPLTALFGYLPGRLSGIGSDLPRDVFWQWRRWCTSKEFHRPDWGKTMPMPDLLRFKGKVRLVGINDDVMVPPTCVKLLAKFYPAAAVEYREIEPKAHGLKSIGHINVFSARCSAAWPALVDGDAAAMVSMGKAA